MKNIYFNLFGYFYLTLINTYMNLLDTYNEPDS